MPGGGGYANQAVVIAIPGVPVGFAIGPVSRPPCMYETTVSVSPTQILIPLPITISGTLGVLLCNDLTSYEAIYGTLAAAVGIPGISPMSPLSLFSWQIASITLSLVNEIQELQCTVDSSGNLQHDSSDAAMLGGMVQRFGTSAARSNCDCLRNTGQRSGVGFAIGGPDIPGFALLLLPFLGQIIAPLSPFLAFVKMRPTASWTFFPYFCNLSRNGAPPRSARAQLCSDALPCADLDFVITLTLDLIFFKDSGACRLRAARGTVILRIVLTDALCAHRKQLTSLTRRSTSWLRTAAPLLPSPALWAWSCPNGRPPRTPSPPP
jgi:hypothetical protein